MRVRLPLYGKILAWFFLNLVAVAAVAVILFNVQFNFKKQILILPKLLKIGLTTF